MMRAYPLIMVFSTCLLLESLSFAETQEGESSEKSESEERERVRQKLRVDPGDRPEGPAKRDPREHIDDHLRGQELLDSYPVEIPESFEKDQ